MISKNLLLLGAAGLGLWYLAGTKARNRAALLKASQAASAAELVQEDDFNSPSLPVEWLPEAVALDGYGRYVRVRR